MVVLKRENTYSGWLSSVKTVALKRDNTHLTTQPVGVCLRGLAVWFAGLRVHWAVGDKELPVECGRRECSEADSLIAAIAAALGAKRRRVCAPLKNEAVCGASKRQRGAFGLGDFAIGLAAIEFWGFAEVGQKVARHVPAASAGRMVLVRWDG